jgi:hypothetical protein
MSESRGVGQTSLFGLLAASQGAQSALGDPCGHNTE